MKGWTRRSRLRRAHNDEDPACRHWWGDRAGMDMNARCYVCRPARASLAERPPRVEPERLTREQLDQLPILDVSHTDFVYVTNDEYYDEAGELLVNTELGRHRKFLARVLELAYSAEANLVAVGQFPNVVVPAATRLLYQLRASLPDDLIALASNAEATASSTSSFPTPMECHGNDAFCTLCSPRRRPGWPPEAPAATEEELTPLVGVPAPPEVPEADDDPDDDPEVEVPSSLRHELAAALNRVSAENGSDTPDFVLAEYLAASLEVFDTAVRQRDTWYGYKPWGKERG